MAACQAPTNRMPFLQGGEGARAAGSIHPLIALRLRMQQGAHKHAVPGVGSGSIPRTIAVPPLAAGESPPLADGDCIVTPLPLAYPRSLSPPPTPGRPRRPRAKRSSAVDVSSYPEFIPAGRLSRKKHAPSDQSEEDEPRPQNLKSASPPRQAPSTPFRPEPRFECRWVRRVDAEMGNASDEEDRPERLPCIPYAPFDFSSESSSSSKAPPPPRMTEMTLKPSPLPSPPPLSMGSRGSSRSPEERVSHHKMMSRMSLSGGSAAAAAVGGGRQMQKRAGRTNVNARCA